MDVVKRIRDFLKRLETMEKTSKSEETVRGKFGGKGGLLSGAYEYLVRIGIKKKQGDRKWTGTKGSKS